jgi:hypothetical protein
MLTSVQFCDLLGLALSTPHDLAKSVFHKLSASANGVHQEQVPFFMHTRRHGPFRAAVEPAT